MQLRKSIGAQVVMAALALAACTTVQPLPPVDPAQVGELVKGSTILKGYLAPSELPDSLALLPPPPAEGSAALAEDTATFRALTALQAGPRGQWATRDANLSYPATNAIFACALGMTIDAAQSPHLAMLMRRTLGDAALATYKAKDKYQRTRPFVAFKAATCTPAEEAMLAKDGSYPSGHSSIGWAWALVLAEIAPERADALLQRGRAFSQSRAVCGVHWQSDIESGRLIGAATVARMHANPVFRAQLDAARSEVAQGRARGLPAGNDCAAEAAALASTTQFAP